MLSDVLITILFIFLIIYFYLKYNYGYFKRKGIPFIPGNLLFGNLTDIALLKTDAREMVQRWYNHQSANNQPFVGIHVFFRHGILVRDPELIKQVMVKDFNKFSNRSSGADIHNDALASANIFFAKNPEWRTIRQKLTPVFTSGKLKQMFPLINNVGLKLSDFLNGQTKIIEAKSICGFYTIDVIASIAFGLEANSFTNPQNEFRMAGLSVTDISLRRVVDAISIFFIPKLSPLVKAKLFPPIAENAFRRIFSYTIKNRRESGLFRNDLVDILIAFQDASKNGETEIEFTDDMLLAQAALFFLAGNETSSSAMSFALYELSKKPEIQEKLRREIRSVYDKEGDNVSYESINSMEYLSMVLNETIRLYPTLPFLDREVTIDSNEEGYSLEPYSGFNIPNGTPIYIPVAGLHYDPNYFPDPTVFDPERFSKENKDNIKPGTFIPFGMGPHNCIGERLGLLQAKVGLYHFLKKHSVKPNDKSMKTMILKKGVVVQAEDIFMDLIKD